MSLNVVRTVCVARGHLKSANRMPTKKKQKLHDVDGQSSKPDMSCTKHTGVLCKEEVVYLAKDGNIMIVIKAKPSSKHNGITDISSDGIGVQIAAAPREGDANNELIKFIASVLKVKKSCISLDKGSKSRQKILRVSQCTGLTEKTTMELLTAAVNC